MGVGAGLYMYYVVVRKFAFDISISWWVLVYDRSWDRQRECPGSWPQRRPLSRVLLVQTQWLCQAGGGPAATHTPWIFGPLDKKIPGAAPDRPIDSCFLQRAAMLALQALY